jgi:spore coat polysaccharide biosynthesis predicted glycosyltransferase SpsG
MILGINFKMLSQAFYKDFRKHNLRTNQNIVFRCTGLSDSYSTFIRVKSSGNSINGQLEYFLDATGYQCKE